MKFMTGKFARLGVATLLGATLAGCAQTNAALDNMLLGPKTMDRSALAERMYGDCSRATKPIFGRPASELVGKCKCASVSFLNYATDEQVSELRMAWVSAGPGQAFDDKVLATTEAFHATHCGARASNAELLRLTSLGGSSKPKASTGSEMPMVEVVTEPDTANTLMSNATGSGITRFELAPSAFADKDLVRYIQRKLKGLGYSPGPIDGVVGKRTTSALRAYQSAKGMPEDASVEDVMTALIF